MVGPAGRLFSASRSQSAYQPGGGNTESLLGGFFRAGSTLSATVQMLWLLGLSLPYRTPFSVPHHITLWGSCPFLHLPCPGLCQLLSFPASLATEQVYPPSWGS